MAFPLEQLLLMILLPMMTMTMMLLTYILKVSANFHDISIFKKRIFMIFSFLAFETEEV